MPTAIEQLNQGLCNVKDRSMLRPGQLARANNVYYQPHDPALYKHPGRDQYNSSAIAATTLLGLRYLEYDNAVSRLLALYASGTDGKLAQSSFTGETGSFTAYSQAIGLAQSLDAVFYNNRYSLLTGVPTPSGDLIGGNLSIGADSVVRRNGLAPVVSPPKPGPVVVGVSGSGTTAGSWPNNDEFPLGWYFFITTEVTDEAGESAPDFLESSWEGETMFAVNVTSQAQSVQIEFPTLVNSGKYSNGLNLIQARRVYMAGPVGGIDPVPTTQPQNPPLSDFRLVGQAPVGTPTVLIGSTALDQAATSSSQGGTFSFPSNASSDNNSGATTNVSTSDLRCYNFNFATTGTVKGVQVEIKARRMFSVAGGYSAMRLVVGLSKDSGASVAGTAKTLEIPALLSYETYILGGPTDRWDADPLDTTGGADGVDNAAFGVRIVAFLDGPGVMDIDVVRVRVFTDTGSTVPFGQEFPTVVIPIGGGTEEIWPSHSEPPTASSGDVFQGCVVTNDIAEPTHVVYSLPDRPEYFPKRYRIKLKGKVRGSVLCVRRVGEVLLAGGPKNIWRINRLPREEDAFFDYTRVYDDLCTDKGVVSPFAICTFTTPTRTELAAFVSLNGIHWTDGHSVDTLVEDINWRKMVNVKKLGVSTLRNYSSLHLMAFDYVPADDLVSTRPTKRLILHYHPSHVKETGKLLVTGPIDLPTSCGDVGYVNNDVVMVSGCTDGRVYIEDRGWQDGLTNTNLICDFVTRDLYPAAVGYEATFERVWWRHFQYADPELVLVVTPWNKNSDGDYFTPAAGPRWHAKAKLQDVGAPLVGDLSTLNNAGALRRTDEHFICESTCFQGVTSDSDQGFGISYFAMEYSGRKLQE